MNLVDIISASNYYGAMVGEKSSPVVPTTTLLVCALGVRRLLNVYRSNFLSDMVVSEA